MNPGDGHFPGCHPEDAQAPDSRMKREGYAPQETEECWHCDNATAHGCNCWECQENADYVPPSAAYHCKTCGRWWAWMTGLNITTITFGADAER